MNKKQYQSPSLREVRTSIRASLLAASTGISNTQSAAGVPEDTPHVSDRPLPPGGSFD